MLDTAVGLHCGVIRALLEVDLAYAVTEPTPLGEHDLSLILKLLVRLKVLKKIIINQANLGNKSSIYRLAQKFKAKVIKEIPYSKEIVIAYSQGKLNKLNVL